MDPLNWESILQDQLGYLHMLNSPSYTKTERDKDTDRDKSRDNLNEWHASDAPNVGFKQHDHPTRIGDGKDILLTYSRTERDQDTHRDDTGDKALSAKRSNVGRKQRSPPSSVGRSRDSRPDRDEDQDGDLLDTSEDPELVRKMFELRKIEEKIMRKKASLAHKQVEPPVKKAACVLSGGNKNYHRSTPSKSETLKERVCLLLQQRRPQVHSSSSSDPTCVRLRPLKDTRTPLSHSGEDRLHGEHPLKARVMALMRRRRRGIQLLASDRDKDRDKIGDKDRDRDREVCDTLPPPPPFQNSGAAVQEDNKVNIGFLRFLNVLNKGVDIGLLNRIVNSDGEEGPLGKAPFNSWPAPAMDEESDLSDRSQSQPSISEVRQQSHSRSKSGERTEPAALEGSYPQGRSVLKEKKDGGDGSFQSHAGKESPPAAEVKKPKVDERHEQLQNVLRTLGFSLEAEEMSKLADRTQERLYGKNPDGKQKADHKAAEPEFERRNVGRDHKSSSCSSNSSRSSPSPLRSSNSDSIDPTPTSQSSRSNKRRDVMITPQDGSRDSGTTLKIQIKCPTNVKEVPHRTYPETPDASVAMPLPSLDQQAQYHPYYGGHYSGATNSAWNFTQVPISSSYVPTGFPYVNNPSYPTIAAPGGFYLHHNSYEDVHITEQDLYMSEGQTGVPSRPRCLLDVHTKPAQRQQVVLQLTKSYKKRREALKKQRRRERRMQMIDAAIATTVHNDDPTSYDPHSQERANFFSPVFVSFQDDPPTAVAKQDSSTQQEVEDGSHLTEEEIKANLKKKLEAFNQKMRQKGKSPGENSLQ